MKQRIITGLLLALVLIPVVIVGNVSFQVAMALIAGVATFELLSICKNPKAHIYLYGIVGIFLFYSIFTSNKTVVPSINIAIYLIVLLVCGIFDAGIDFARLSYYFTGGTLVALGLHMVYVMRMHLGLSYVLLLAIATLGADTFAYFVGRAIGKHKLNPRLSPNKTIEGSIGGIICGGTLALAFGFLMKMPLSLAQLIIISYVLSSTGQIGDLTFSSIKRYFEVKDYSQIFPGHGGVLDRFDSIIFNAMVLGLLLNILL